jgi:hypothetical protein
VHHLAAVRCLKAALPGTIPEREPRSATRRQRRGVCTAVAGAVGLSVHIERVVRRHPIGGPCAWHSHHCDR